MSQKVHEVTPTQRRRFAKRLSEAAVVGKEIQQQWDRFWTKFDELPRAEDGMPGPDAIEEISASFNQLMHRLDDWRKLIQEFDEASDAYQARTPARTRYVKAILEKLHSLVDASREGGKTPTLLLRCTRQHRFFYRRPHLLIEHHLKDVAIQDGIDALLELAEFIQWQVDGKFFAHISGAIHGDKG